jgi:hypothetical protein
MTTTRNIRDVEQPSVIVLLAEEATRAVQG